MLDDGYGSRPSDFMDGERVELHPEIVEANGWSAQATVHAVGRDWVHVRFDGTAKVVMIRANRIRPAARV